MIIFRRLSLVTLMILLSLFELTTTALASPAQGMLQPALKPFVADSIVGSFEASALSGSGKDKLIFKNESIKFAQMPLLQSGIESNLTLEPLKPFALGDHPTMILHLTTEFGKPIANQPITIYVDGKRKASGVTDSAGVASLTLKYKFPAGKYHIRALYNGVPVLGIPMASVEADMLIQPANATIRTIPAMAGIKFKFDGHIYTSNENGFVSFQVNKSGTYLLEVMPVDTELLLPNTTMEFSRWNDNIFTSRREIYFPRTRPIEAGFIFNYLVNEVFYDSTGAIVDPARISSMTLKGLGRTYTFDRAGPIWLPANRLARRIGEKLQSQGIVYYFKDIQIDGANVINKSQQSFHLRPNDVWSINVLLYSIRFSSRDAMFRFAIGSGIELTYPDGHIDTFFFDSSKSEIEIPSLARGSYSATVISNGGSAPSTPIHLSRDQDVELLVLSFLDMAIIFGAPLLLALTLFFIGRPHQLRKLRRISPFQKQTNPAASVDIN